jgi:hypothetical protein
MTDETLPPLPLPSRRNGTYDSAAFRFYTEQQMHAFARAAILLDRQQRAAPTYGSIAERAADGKDAGMWQPVPSAEPERSKT